MFFNARNRTLDIAGSTMHYICFGKGSENIILIPGVGDGIKTVKGMALPMAFAYRAFAQRYRVFAFSRKNCLPKSYSNREMAADVAKAMQQLNLEQAHIIGISQGGMIAQYLAIDYPQLIGKLVLGVTLAKPNPTMQQTLGSWLQMAQAGDYKRILTDSIEKAYSEKLLRKYRPWYPLISRIGKPRSFERFITQLQACLAHDAAAELHKISCKTLIIGGDADKVVGARSSAELAEAIPHSLLHIYPGLGHAAYSEAADFNARVMAFLSD